MLMKINELYEAIIYFFFISSLNSCKDTANLFDRFGTLFYRVSDCPIFTIPRQYILLLLWIISVLFICLVKVKSNLSQFLIILFCYYLISAVSLCFMSRSAPFKPICCLL
jgi:hypothetical protein